MKIPMATASTPSLAPPSAAPLPAVIPLCSPTLPHEAMPPWFHAVASPSILRGYRATDQRLFFYVVSALYPHNESINIWSHLLGTCAFITLAIDNSDDVYLVLYCLAAAACFIISSSFHLLLPSSKALYTRLQRLDYASIFVLIGSSAIPYYSVEYKCHSNLELVAVITTAMIMAVLAVVVATQAWFGKDTPRGRIIRVVAFGTFAVACVAFGGIAALLDPPFSPRPYLEAEPALRVALNSVTVLYVAALVIYCLEWPERCFPRRFDLIGASHQSMHVLVLAAALLNAWCIRRTRELRHVVAPCSAGSPSA